MAQEVVAAAIGVRTLSYGRWERDQQLPGLVNRLALARYFDVDPSEFVEDGVIPDADSGARLVANVSGPTERLAALETRIDGIEQTIVRCEAMLVRITKLLSGTG